METLYAKSKKEKGIVYVRNFIRDLLLLHSGNVSKVSSILGCSRPCIYRAINGPPEDISRAPKHRAIHQTSLHFEDLILKERERTKYGRVRLSKYLERKFGISIASGTIRNVFRRNEVKKHQYVRSSKIPKPLYDYEHILPFEHIQVDTKHIEDFGAL